jgi:hypothetical protein
MGLLRSRSRVSHRTYELAATIRERYCFLFRLLFRFDARGNGAFADGGTRGRSVETMALENSAFSDDAAREQAQKPTDL